ncbi:MAG TPA: DNA-directed RNA polymerase subunit delta [Tetragenococcus sp.]|nr:DNA-directed RNA polymerase subunit delta [Tetragenococcus sp.]
MEIKVFKDVNKADLSMIEVAHAILEQNGEVMHFTDIVNAIQEFLGTPDSEIRDSLAQFYTDLNIDGSFISLGENRWGLRSWYAIDSINEEITHEIDEEDEDNSRRRKRKKVNAFINDDEDAIDYNDDDPEDADLVDDDDELFDDDDDDDDEEIAEYNSDLQEIGADDTGDDEEELPGSIEEDLTIVDDDDDDYEEDEEN